MRIGYACICIGVDGCRQRTCIQKFVSEVLLEEIIRNNIQALFKILRYNEKHHIRLFRLSSDIVPFGSSPVNTLDWKTMFKEELKEIGTYIKQHHMRVSSHPGQYTILNALDQDIIQRAIEDLVYHCAILDLMELDQTHKMVLHVGGIYGDKKAAIKRFIEVYKTLPEAIKNRLIIENDDRYYTVEDVLYISSQCQIPVVFDNLHHAILHPDGDVSTQVWLERVRATWKDKDGVQKIHYSQQALHRRVGAHAQTIAIDPFLSFVSQLKFDLDIMLEVKDKNISALKAWYLLHPEDDLFYEEWRRYQYLFYLHSLSYFAIYEYVFQQRKVIDRYAFYHMAEVFMKEEIMHEHYRSLFAFIKQRWYHMLNTRNQALFDRFVNGFMKGDVTSEKGMAGLYRIAQREHIQEGMDALLLFVEV